MITRMTNQTMVRSALQNLQTNLNQMSKLQEQASSQKLISRPSDDPAATASALAIRADQRANEQYGRNIGDGNNWLTTVDSALSNVSVLMNKVRDLTVQGANDGALSPSAKEAIALELESLRSELLVEANSTYLGRSVFAGNSDTGAAFAADYSFSGEPGSTVERRISGESTIRVDADGAAVFGTGSNSVFALVDTIVNDLRSGVNVGSHLTSLDARKDTILGQHAVVGSRHAQLERAKEANVDQFVALETQRSGVEDVDLAKVILDLQVQQVSYQTALAVTARVLQPTLMDFLR